MNPSLCIRARGARGARGATLSLALLCSSSPGALIEAWLADDLAVNHNDGDQVTTWTSSGGRHLSAGGANQPVYKEAVTPTGGAAVRFNESRLQVGAGNSPVGGLSQFSVAVVFRADAAGANDGTQWWAKTGLVDAEQLGFTNDWGAVLDENGQVGFGTGSGDNSTYSTGPSIVDGNFHAAIFSWGPNGQTVYLDNRAGVSDAASTNVRNNAGLSVGSIHTNVAGRKLMGDIAEIRFYDTALDAAEAQAVIGELQTTHIIAGGPFISSFAATNANIYEGDSALLFWSITNVTGTLQLSIDNGAPPILDSASVGFVIVDPLITTTYLLSATDAVGSSTTQVTVMVDPGVPSADQQSLSVAENGLLPITLTGSDPNPAPGGLSYSIESGPIHGQLTGTPPLVVYAPTPGYFGADSFTFKVNDATYDSPPAAVTIEVEAGPRAPTDITVSTTDVVDTSTNGSFLAALSTEDPNENDVHTYSLVQGFGDNALFSVAGDQLLAATSFTGLGGTVLMIRIRSTDSATLTVEKTFTFSVVEAPGGVVINEIHYDPVNNTDKHEFIELYNTTSLDVELDNWRLSGAVDYVFPVGTTITANSYLLVAEDPAAFLAKFGVQALGPYAGRLTDDQDGETVRLRDFNDNVLDFVDYRVGFPWPVGAAGEGGSMELINPSLDNELGSSWRTSTTGPTPGALNSVFADNAAPNIRQVNHSPQTPDLLDPDKIASQMPVAITAKITDPEGVGSVQLEYQVNRPGVFQPAELPVLVSTLNANSNFRRRPNPGFYSSSRWVVIPMVNDGSGDDAVANDAFYTATIPGQQHRALVRYRIVVEDAAPIPLAERVPYADDPSLNFAYFVYNGVPDYFAAASAQGGSRTYPAEDLTTMPVYHFITRQADLAECLAYSGNRMSGNGNPARRVYNWEAALVYNGQVYDHIRYRLRGANGRYHGAGKRSMKFRFNKGDHLEARGLDGKKYRNPWRVLTVSKQFSNRGVGNFGLADSINNKLWNMVGTPAPLTHWFHFRVIDTPREAPNQWGGDFWGFFLAVERYDSRFIDQHDLDRGNLYKLSDNVGSALNQLRYQAPDARATSGQDFTSFENNMRSSKSEAWIRDNANIEKWAWWSAVKEAVRHYDYWPSANKNMAYYFEPDYLPGNGNYGKLWLLPYDVDDTWGPVWNNGIERIKESVSNKANIRLEERNAVREFRDLIWQRDQLDAMIDDFAAYVEKIHPADRDRWRNAPASEGREDWGTLANKVTDMKRYAWTGGSWPGGSVGAGGRAAYLDSYARDGAIPSRPSLTYFGSGSYPGDIKTTELAFRASRFSDPQGSASFGAMEWRVAEVGLDGDGVRHLEWDASWESGELTSVSALVSIPPVAMRPGHTYRVRVRFKDNSGRWSKWSAPLEFAPTAPDVQVFVDSLMITEIMYHPSSATPTEIADGYSTSDFEFIEMKNIGTSDVDLRDLSLTLGVDFSFAGSAIEQLSPGDYVLVVANENAFASRHGAGLPVAGAWDRNDRLNNSGEIIELTFGANTPIRLFTYDDLFPWPESPDGAGYSLTLRQPESRPPHEVAASWRPSRGTGGSPGTDDGLHLGDWMTVHGIADLFLDDDNDGNSNLLEHVLGTDPNNPADLARPVVWLVDDGGLDHLALTFTLPYSTDDVDVSFEVSRDLLLWESTTLDVSQLEAPVNNGDGSYTVTYRDLTPILGTAHRFIRLSAVVKSP